MLAFTAGNSAGSTGQTAAVDIHAIDSIARAQADSGFSGVVLVALDDSVILRRAYGAPPSKLTARSAFWIASMTKGFTAAAMLRLQEQGRLSLRDSLHRFLPAVPADKRAITILQLLTHTSGLGAYSGGGIHERDAAVRAILAQPLAFEPGQGYRYGDDDYELLAAIIEVVTGQPWEVYVREQLVRPAGLTRVGFACRQADASSRPVRSTPVCDWGHKGANGMSATADDVFRWTRALHEPGVLGAAGAGALEKPLVLVRREEPFDVSYGYGVRVYARADTVVEVMHSGSGDDGHTGVARVLRSGVTIVVLANAGMRHGTTWSSWVARQLAARD